MGLDRDCYELEDLWNCGPDQSIDSVGDGRLGSKLEGMEIAIYGMIR